MVWTWGLDGGWGGGLRNGLCVFPDERWGGSSEMLGMGA